MAFFDASLAGPWQARARALRTQLDQDAVSRDRAGTRPDAALLQLRASGLPAATLPAATGGGDAPLSEALQVVRELARTDGSLAQLYGEHLVPLHRLIGLAGVAGGGSDPDRADPLARSAATALARTVLADSARQQWIWAQASAAAQAGVTVRRREADVEAEDVGARPSNPTTPSPGGAWVLNGEVALHAAAATADRLLVDWRDAAGAIVFAALPLDRPGLVVSAISDRFGQRQLGRGRLVFDDLLIDDDEILGRIGAPASGRQGEAAVGEAVNVAPAGVAADGQPGELLRRAVRAEVFIGSALGALDEGRAYTTSRSRPWIHAGVDRHQDDPWVLRRYGEAALQVQAASDLADRAGQRLDAALANDPSLAADPARAVAALARAGVAVATAYLYARQVGLDAGSTVFEVMGARSATTANGYDRFWRNVRVASLDETEAAGQRALGRWLLAGGQPPVQPIPAGVQP